MHHPMTPEEHREHAVLHLARAEQPDLTAEQMSAYAAIARAHAALAAARPAATGTWANVVSLLVLVAGVVAVTWLVTG